MTDEHDVIYLEPLEEYYGWEGRGWSTEDYYADIRDRPGVKFLLATPKRLAADDLYAALEALASAPDDWTVDKVNAARSALSKARSQPIPEGGEK